MFKLLMFSFFVLWVVGCATGSDRLTVIEPGMEKKHVVEVWGEPQDRTFRGMQEKWIYKTGETEKVVVFEKGKVVELVKADGSGKEAFTAKGQNPGPSEEQNADRPAYCVGSNSYGKYPEGGGCNMYGCWPKGGYCNAFGCTSSGRCTAGNCPNAIKSYQCVE